MNSIESYRISPVTGFLLEEPLKVLPKQFHSWQHLFDNVHCFIKNRQLRDEIQKLPDFETTALASHRAKCLGHVVVATLTSAYVWQNGESDLPKFVPRKLSIPLCQLSTELGILPIIGHSDLVLNNTILLKDPCDIENPMTDMCLIARMVDSTSWDSFFLITSMMELKFSPAVEHVMAIARLSNEANQDDSSIQEHLEKLSSIVRTLKKTMSVFHKFLDATTFYNDIRPFLGGWDKNSKIFPEGLIYEGVSESPIYCHGGSAAQSPILQTLDITLGNMHSTESQYSSSSERQKFLKEMRQHMIKEHRQFLIDLEQTSRLREAVVNSCNMDLKNAFNGLVGAVEDLRSYHISLVSKFIIIPSRTQKNEFHSLSTRGTGGQDLIPFLKDIRDSTRDSKISIEK